MSRRPSSTLIRERCFEYWAVAWGITRILKCYLCGRVWEEKDWGKVEAEHEIPRALGMTRYGKAIDDPWNVKPCCSGVCESLQQPSTSNSTEPSPLPSTSYKGHRDKTKADIKRIAKVNRIRAKASHFKRSKKPMQGSRASAWARKYNRLTGRWESVRRDK